MLRQGYFAQHRESTKRTKYTDVAVSIGAKFIPLVFETYGSIGKSFQLLLNSLASELFRKWLNSDVEQESNMKACLLTLWRTRLSLTLQEANARLLLSKISRTNQATQRSQPTSTVDSSIVLMELNL